MQKFKRGVNLKNVFKKDYLSKIQSKLGVNSVMLGSSLSPYEDESILEGTTESVSDIQEGISALNMHPRTTLRKYESTQPDTAKNLKVALTISNYLNAETKNLRNMNSNNDEPNSTLLPAKKTPAKKLHRKTSSPSKMNLEPMSALVKPIHKDITITVETANKCPSRKLSQEQETALPTLDCTPVKKIPSPSDKNQKVEASSKITEEKQKALENRVENSVSYTNDKKEIQSSSKQSTDFPSEYLLNEDFIDDLHIDMTENELYHGEMFD